MSEVGEKSLRDVVKQDYKKMDKGKSVAELRSELCAGHDGAINNNNKDGIRESDGLEETLGEESLGDEEMDEMEKKIEAMQDMEKKLVKKNRQRRLSKKAEEMEERIACLQKESKQQQHQSKKKITSASLRGMDQVMEKVDKMMDEKLHLLEDSSSSEEGSSCSDVEESSDSSDSTRKKKKKKGHGKKSKSKSKRSGKSKKVTSSVKFPQLWPQSQLSQHFVNKSKTYEDLSIAEFCAGFAGILEVERSEVNRVCMIAHLKDLMYLATRYYWKNVLSYHAACLLEIERGKLKWGDSFLHLQNTTLAGGFIFQNNFTPNSNAGSRGGAFGGSRGGSANQGGPVLFCRNYQRGTCTFSQDHMGALGGDNRFLRHICAKCWLNERKRAAHPESSTDCPSYEAEL